MQIILAVDIKGGKVVKAFAGLRFNYKPLYINNEDFSDPIKLIEITKKKIDLRNVYIADLDAINRYSCNNELINRLLAKFPDINFYIDAGFDYPISIFNYHSEKRTKKLTNYSLVLGTETLKNFSLESYIKQKKLKFSIDFNGDQKKWITKFKNKKSKLDIILMFLDKVGGRGMNLKLIKRLVNHLIQHGVYVAGGINSQGQIEQLKSLGVKGVVLSTLIHNRISRDENLSP